MLTIPSFGNGSIVTDQQIMSWLQEDGPASLAAFGRENGFNERADVVVAADGTDLNVFWGEILKTVSMRNADRNDIISRLTYRTNEITEEVQVPSEANFERASEYGQPKGLKGTATRFFRGYDFDFFDLAIRYTWMYIAEADRRQLQLNHNLALEADTKLQFQLVMQRLFNPLNGSGFTDKNEPVTVYAAYNADGEVPPKYKHNSFDGTHNHYLVSGGAAITPANLDTLAESVEEHGYTIQRGYQLVLWVNKQEAAVIKTFRVADGAPYDFVINPNQYNGKIWVPTDGKWVGGPQGAPLPGEIGTYGPFRIVEEAYIPAGYAVVVATGGPDNITNPIAIREHSNAAYRGLKLIPGQRSDYPLLDSFYRRGMGTGIRHRGALTVMQIKASGNYQIPSDYDPANF